MQDKNYQLNSAPPLLLKKIKKLSSSFISYSEDCKICITRISGRWHTMHANAQFASYNIHDARAVMNNFVVITKY
jgi:hypothetical protein